MHQPTAWPLERYRSLLRLYVRQLQLDSRLRRRFDASDLVHDAYVKALKGLDRCQARTEAEFVAWLRKILERVAIDQCRAAHAGKRDAGLEQSLPIVIHDSSARFEQLVAARGPSPSGEAMSNELRLRLAEAIDQLPEYQRDAVILRDLCQKSMADIAEQLGKSERAIAGLLLRGRCRLGELLDDLR
jgi:RNA polymerase sigma-70 factor (ECF subfamily)